MFQRAILNPEPRTLTPRCRGFSLLEMLATVAALVIVLGLMVSLARYVRRRASDQLTKQVLAQLDQLMQHYKERNGMLPDVPPFVAPSPLQRSASSPGMLAAPTDDSLPEESELQRSAKANNQAFVAALRIEARRRPTEFGKLPQLFLEDAALPDAWGTPIVFMPALHPDVGMALENKPFFFSAGPDLKFRTMEDNLYSYETGEEGSGFGVQGSGVGSQESGIRDQESGVRVQN